MNTRITHTPEHPHFRVDCPTFAPDHHVPTPDPATVPTAVLPRPDPVAAAVAALRGVNAAIDNAWRAMEPLTPEQQDAAVVQVDPHPSLLDAEKSALADGRAEALAVARKHLARFGPTSYAHPALAALVAELEAL